MMQLGPENQIHKTASLLYKCTAFSEIINLVAVYAVDAISY
jgi:hypothetical protein